jgi:leucyl-tRNA synthetase
MEYKFRDIEKKWQEWWKVNKVYKVSNDSAKPKYYVLDMFPYPSGAGLHVGHPLGYIASDIYARFKRLKGFNVLHPMGYDAFGLPAEQYAIEHGIHPAISTENNINTFRKQLDNIGFCYDWDREVRTCNPDYYKWTQWIFLQIFDSWFNRKTQKAERISALISIFEKDGNLQHAFPNVKYELPTGKKNFSALDWKTFDEKTKQEVLMQYRLAYLAYTDVNWCEALGTVLANDEVINGVSYRGGFPVVKKKMRQWSLRITEFAERLLSGLDKVDFSTSMKEIQRNWIGKSTGAEIDFRISIGEAVETRKTLHEDSSTKIKDIAIEEIGNDQSLRVYTTRPDTIFGVDFMVLAPEHELVEEITTPKHKKEVDEYLTYVQGRSEVERMAEVKKITGCFTGSYAIHPFSGKRIPIWISEYVLIGYGTGAIMGVPCGDERDHKFAKHFNIPITNIIGSYYNGEEANATKDAILENSDFLNGLVMHEAIDVAVNKIESSGVGESKVNYKMRDAGWSRQRYWGEPFPIIFRNDIPYAISENDLPLDLPHLDDFKPAGNGEGPLANAKDWVYINEDEKRDTNTMPTHAGAAWYFLRYTDPHNKKAFADRKVLDYWGQVDVYIGGSEHAVAHLLYSRLWIKILHDLGHLNFDEPFKKLINQGKITGDSRYVYRIRNTHQFVSSGLKDKYETDALHVDVNIVDGFELDTEAFKRWKPDFANAEFILENGKYICGSAIEKMSKSYFNVVNPDDLILKYGSDTFRMYEMFLGPLEMSKPWDTKGIEGVHRFLKKLWRLFFDEVKGPIWTTMASSPLDRAGGEIATDAELKVLHKTIKKIEEDTERFSFNTGVSSFMICVNELTDLKCHKKEVLEQLLILLAPYAPHISEELWSILGNSGTILDAPFPEWKDKYLKETSKAYPVAINGKTRTELTIALDATQQQVEDIIIKNAIVMKWLDGKPPKKIIYVKNKMINVVV